MAKKKDEPLREAKVVDTPEDETGHEFVADDSMLLPNQGEQMSPEVDEEVQQEVIEDNAMFKGSHPLVDAVFDWLDNEIADCDSIEAAHGIAKEYSCSIEHAMTALDVCRKVFTAKKVSFQNIHDTVNTESN